MFGIGFALFLVAMFVCVALAGRMAVNRSRSAALWMLAAALFGPVPLLALIFMPRKTSV